MAEHWASFRASFRASFSKIFKKFVNVAVRGTRAIIPRDYFKITLF